MIEFVILFYIDV